MGGTHTPPCRVAQSAKITRFDLVWSSQHGWGLVRTLIDESRAGALSVTLRIRVDEDGETTPEEESRPRGTLYYPDVDREEAFEGEVLTLAEPIKARGLVEESIRRTDDGLAQAVPIGWSTLLREDAPRVFPIALALHRWDCAQFLQEDARAFAQWADQCIGGLTKGYWRETMRKLRRQALHSVGALEVHGHVFSRILAAATRDDLEHAIQTRRDQDSEEILHALEVGLTRAATDRGVEGASRRFKARLLELRRTYGTEERAFWDGVAAKGAGLMDERHRSG